MTDPTLPAPLAEIRDDFLALGKSDQLQLLLEFSNELPALPERYRDHSDLFERVVECQSPVFIFTELDEQSRFHMFATAPAESPTTRGFASILVQGLDGLTADEVLAVPADFPSSLGLGAAVSPLRIRGMTAMLARAKRRVRELLLA